MYNPTVQTRPLVERIKHGQRASQHFRAAWGDWIARNGLLKNDPSLHSDDILDRAMRELGHLIPPQQPQQVGSQRGIVRSWVDGKGFGFITPDNGPDDLFVHKSAFGGGALRQGEVVFFDVEQTQTTSGQKARAINVGGPAVTTAPRRAPSQQQQQMGGYQQQQMAGRQPQVDPHQMQMMQLQQQMQQMSLGGGMQQGAPDMSSQTQVRMSCPTCHGAFICPQRGMAVRCPHCSAAVQC
eukprot:TRINITY_DN1358_c12_g1_i1.p1 TRINITY_DN1358_c12_g1~~TRINITY_DN1358_c12_g1_i1.p1  ORF type:complete len:239 (+),score=52.38 TRINITY_DN1358_c12_g1_i1:116-832(+)